MLLQTSEESNDGSLLVALFSLHPIMAPIPGVGLLRNDAKIYESTDRTVPETQDLVMQTVQEQENLADHSGNHNGCHPHCFHIWSCLTRLTFTTLKPFEESSNTALRNISIFVTSALLN